MKEIDIGIITAPREVNTLDFTVKSLRRFVDCPLFIFAEPGELKLTTWDATILVNKEQLGALRNYDHALRWILKHSDKPYIWITEDDYIYNSDLPKRIQEVLEYKEDFGYFNLFTNYWNPALPNPVPEKWVKHTMGYHDAWGMNYILKRESAKKLIEHPTYKHYVETTKKCIDGVISQSFKEMGLAMFYHNPSPSCTCGVVSTLGHEHKTDGLHFRANK